MSDRYNYLTVVLDHDIRYDDAEPLINAIRQLKGVLNVKAHVSNSDSWASDERARFELGEKLLAIVFPKNEL
jgi:hypothetical protein